MRLKSLDGGQRLPQRLTIGMIRLVTGHRVPDVLRTIFYRPEYFGKNFSALVQDTLRGPSDWTIGERELFASFTSKMNDCEF